MNENVDIFVYSHIPFVPKVSNPVYKILTNSHDDFPSNIPIEIFRDYTGDNISDENLMYNEYSGLYWIWKNYPVKEFVGLNHYRRYYSWLDNLPDISKIMEKNRIILNSPVKFIEGGLHQKHNNYTWYGFWHNHEDFELLEKVFKEHFKDYMNGFEKMKKAEYLYNSSMFIMRHDDFYKFMDFIFDVLHEYMKAHNFRNHQDCIDWVNANKDKYLKRYLQYYDVTMQSRIVGYIAERAMNAYIMNGDNSIENNAFIEPWVFYSN